MFLLSMLDMTFLLSLVKKLYDYLKIALLVNNYELKYLPEDEVPGGQDVQVKLPAFGE